ncbi:3-oxoacyl-ACP reductase family protein [Bacillus altitudinis]|uniref:SDR family NAD(P)-dependent oxidoreductase n=1 Tax=Bacillus TaxID=1386 RepID=UPI00045C9A6E|nr:3-oxoacyl-ACP reductase family protein [Bacillus altitudinis]KDE32057.1 3-oxoacyl-ACP reductase [Bacillus altitudinis 41KF2b]KSU74688.1 3-ketoacyl-ACP reductase [Bacillus altitudinis]MCY7438437.1 3-oxoacyl-ACP reductase FabG [Bacillus altitudinis]MEC1041945.1 3-oxoacyl-ACP reductase FabG [Bacillus altitudinis]MEC1089967.1 3-oxoacyl-ACP reductase FabG [Bacillus altitudinis]
MTLQNKVAIITGASRGIGRAIAEAFVSEGAKVVLNGTNEVLLQDVCSSLNKEETRAVSVAGDASLPATAVSLVEKAKNHFGQIDILVNNAGINLRKSTVDTSVDEWKRLIDINLTGTFLMCQAVIPDMIKQQGGKIVNMSSTTGKTPHHNASPAYGVSKAGINYLTMHLAKELAAHHIHVNAVCPGPIETDMSKQWSDEYRRSVLERIPLKTIGTPQQVANAVTFLASDQSDFITGETINMNGGTYMN